LLVAAGVAAVLAGIQYRAGMQAQLAEEQATLAQQRAEMAQQQVTLAEVEEGRQALLHDDAAEAQRHLAEASRRGDHSWATAFMLTLASQPRTAEQARFTAAAGRMWSAAFSPDGRQIVTTDDVCAQVWDARTNRLLFMLRHGDTVYDARYSPDGAWLVTAGGDGTVRIWNATTGALLRTLTPQRRDLQLRYSAAVLSSDSKLVAAIDMTGAVVHVWDTSNGTALTELHNDALEFPLLAFSADGRWLTRGGGGDRVGGGQTDRSYPQVEVGASGLFGVARWGRPN